MNSVDIHGTACYQNIEPQTVAPPTGGNNLQQFTTYEMTNFCPEVSHITTIRGLYNYDYDSALLCYIAMDGKVAQKRAESHTRVGGLG